MTSVPPPKFPTIEGQLGPATTRQLLDAGFTRAACRHAVARRWQEVVPGVLAPHTGPLDASIRLAAAALWAGPGAVLTGTVALDRHGLCGADRSHAVFLVPATARSRCTGSVLTVRTTRAVTVGHELGCVLIATVERALLDTALHQDVPARGLTALALAALQRQLTTSDRLLAELARVPRRGTALLRSAATAFSRGAWSLPEAGLMTLFDSNPSLAPMLFNRTLTTTGGRVIGTPDAFCPAAGVAVQVHSRTYHSGEDEDGTDLWSLTVEKDGA